MENINEFEQSKLFELYTFVELAYIKHFKNRYGSEEEIFPPDWYSNRNYKFKIEILTEAIENDILIVNTSKFQETIEGVRHGYVKD